MATAEYHFFNYDGEIQLRDLAYLDDMEADNNDVTQDQDETCGDPGEQEDDWEKKIISFKYIFKKFFFLILMHDCDGLINNSV